MSTASPLQKQVLSPSASKRMQRTESSRALVAALRATEELEAELNEAKAQIEQLQSQLAKSEENGRLQELETKNDELTAKLKRTRSRNKLLRDHVAKKNAQLKKQEEEDKRAAPRPPTLQRQMSKQIDASDGEEPSDEAVSDHEAEEASEQEKIRWWSEREHTRRINAERSRRELVAQLEAEAQREAEERERREREEREREERERQEREERERVERAAALAVLAAEKEAAAKEALERAAALSAEADRAKREAEVAATPPGSRREKQSNGIEDDQVIASIPAGDGKRRVLKKKKRSKLSQSSPAPAEAARASPDRRALDDQVVGVKTANKDTPISSRKAATVSAKKSGHKLPAQKIDFDSPTKEAPPSPDGMSLANPDMSGYLRKANNQGKWLGRFFVLKSSYLLYFRSAFQTSKQKLPQGQKIERVGSHIPLQGATVEKETDPERGEVIVIRHKTMDKVYRLHTSSPEKLQEWFDAIHRNARAATA